MKKFLIGLICIFILTGCSNIEPAKSKEVLEDPIVVKPVSRNEADVSGNCYYGYVEIDNHIYLMFRSLGSHFGGITHSGTCPCNNSNKIEEK
jgi:hypothetical protein